MKKKILSLLAAFFMLFGTSAMAQVDSTLEGDVNGDGVVDIADITAVIAIIKQNAEENPTYYWYAGWTEPTAANIATIVKETYPASKASTTMNPAGKTATSTDGVIMDYSTAKLYNTSANIQYYVVVPNGQGIYDSLGNAMHTSTVAFTNVGTFTNHTIYKSVPNGRSISIIIK